MKRKISLMYIGAFLYRFVFLLLALPIEAILFEGFSPVAVFFTYFTNILIFLLLTLWAILSYRAISLYEEEDRIKLKRGIIIRRSEEIYKEKVTLVTLTRKLLYLPCRTCKLNIHTQGNADQVYMKTPEATRFSHSLTEIKNHKTKKLVGWSFFGLFLICAGFSNVMWGLFTLIPVLERGASIIGEQGTSRLLEILRAESEALLFLIPSSLRLLAGVIFILWFLGLLSAFLKRYSFSLKKSQDTLTVSHGIITKKTLSFPIDRVSAFSLRQSLLPLIFRRCSLVAHLPLEGGEKLISLTLAEKFHTQKKLLLDLGFEEKKKISELKPSGFPLWGYCYKGILFFIFTLLLLAIPMRLPLLFYPWVGLLFVSLAWLLFSFLGLRRSKIALYEGFVVLNHYYPFHLSKSFIPRDKIVAIELSQSPYQRLRKLCTMKIHIKSESRTSFKIISLSKEKAAEFIDLCG